MNNILITGGTGALGSALIPVFLRDPQTEVTLLLRADSSSELEARRQNLLDYLQLEDDARARVTAVSGDTSRENLAIPKVATDRLTAAVTHLVHAAGNVKLNQSLDEARHAAVQSARHIIDFTQRCRANGQFQKLEFISTVGVAGRQPGLIPEERFSQKRSPEDFHNTYEAAKWEAEELAWQEIDNGLPATIHRPSMIVGDSHSGQIIRYQVFYYLIEFIIGRQTNGIVPMTGGAILDIIPVNYVAEAIQLAALRGLGRGEVWHLCSGPEHSWTLERLAERIREMLVSRGQRPPDLRQLALGDFRRELSDWKETLSESQRKFLKGLPFLLDYLESNQVFDNSKTNTILSKHHIEIPSVDSYLEKVITSFWDRASTR
ncbi:MAG: SDR family oxidoreductase [Aureliella sp.]